MTNNSVMVIGGAMDAPDIKVGLQEYCARRDVSERAVRRWLADKELPGATKDAKGAWLIPLNADRVPGGVHAQLEVAWKQHFGIEEALPPVGEILDHQTGYVPLAIAAKIMGCSVKYLRNHEDEYEVANRGHGYCVPQSVIKRVAGL